MPRVSAALRAQLGDTAARDLEEYVDTLGSQWSDKVMHTAAERFDSRLTAEMSSLRLEIQKGFTDLRVELLRWSFVFWIGQVVAVSSILALMLRGILK
jgi:hypothetical protein